MSPRRVFLAIDPSLRCAGFLLVAWDEPGWPLVDAWVSTSPPIPRELPGLQTRREEARAGEDLAETVAVRLDRIHDDPALELVGVALEVSPSAGSRASDPTAAASIARSNQAVVDALRLRGRGVRPLFVSMFEAKWAATGRKTTRAKKRAEGDLVGGPTVDTKTAVKRGVRRFWGPSAWDALPVTRKHEREAIYDAGAVALRVLRDPDLRGLVESMYERRAA